MGGGGGVMEAIGDGRSTDFLIADLRGLCAESSLEEMTG